VWREALLLASFIPERKIKARLRLLNLCSSQRLKTNIDP
jgi:hypothetical protein